VCVLWFPGPQSVSWNPFVCLAWLQPQNESCDNGIREQNGEFYRVSETK
jgi:hypothetical protein